jgi:hypothetical protein
MAAGVTDRAWDMSNIAVLIVAQEAPIGKRGPYKKRAAWVISKDLLFSIWATGMVVIVIYLIFVHVLWRYLRRTCPEIWASLGNPSLLNNSPKNGFLFVRWLLRRDYLQIADPTGVRIAKATEAMFWLASPLIVLMFGLGIATRGGESWPL